MAEPTTALSFEDLLIRVAEAGGIASYSSTTDLALVPTNAYNFFKCKQVVNDGIRQLIGSPPGTGWRWMRRIMEVVFAPAYTGTATAGTSTSLTAGGIAATYDDNYFNGYTLKITGGTGEGETATITDYTGSTGKFDFSGGLSGSSTPDTTSTYRICRSTSVIDADSARYLLDQNFGGAPLGKPTYEADSNRGTRIDWCDESEIRRRREVSVQTGYPTLAAIRPYTHSSNPRRFEIIVDPQPQSIDTILFPYQVFFDKLEMEMGIATGGSAITLVDTARTEVDDYFVGWILKIIDGVGRTQTATITGWDLGTTTFTFTALSGDSTPTTTSRYIVEPANNLHPAGFIFDDTILHACLAKAEMEFEDLAAGWVQIFHQVKLPAAYGIDAQLAPRRISGTPRIRERYWNDVTYN